MFCNRYELLQNKLEKILTYVEVNMEVRINSSGMEESLIIPIYKYPLSSLVITIKPSIKIKYSLLIYS